MPHRTLNGARLNIVEDGDGPDTVVLLHGLLFSHRMFDAQVAALAERLRCVRMDFRGQGDSEVTRSGYDLDTLRDDVIALIEQLETGPVHLVGFSMGGMVAQRVAIERGDLLESLVLMNTSAEAEPRTRRPRYALLNLAARWIGVKRVAPRILDLLFSDAFLADPDCSAERERWLAMVTANDRIGVSRAVKGVIRRRSMLDSLKAINTPTLIISGQNDRATPPSCARRLQERIAGSRLLELPGTGHMAPAEAPDHINRHLSEFLAALP
jgi:pimeloyl-ACP methyl ester carboxylesterase